MVFNNILVIKRWVLPYFSKKKDICVLGKKKILIQVQGNLLAHGRFPMKFSIPFKQKLYYGHNRASSSPFKNDAGDLHFP